MLQRDVQITAHFGVMGHLVQHIFGKICRIGVMDPYPLYAFDFAQRDYQSPEGALAVEVQTIVGCILGYEYQFFDSASGQGAGFLHKSFYRDALVRTADERDGAIGASAVATFGYLEVGVALTLDFEASAGYAPLPAHAKILKHRGEVPGAEPPVHLGHLLLQVGSIALGQAAEHCELSYPAFLFKLTSL